MIWRKCRKGFSDFPGEINVYYESDGNFMDEEAGKTYSKTIRISDLALGKFQIRPIQKSPHEEMLLSDIKITKAFKRSLPQSWKILRQFKHYRRYNKFDNKIIVDDQNYLRDGYTQYLIAKMLGIENVSVYKKLN